jgi:hypothetical protein
MAYRAMSDRVKLAREIATRTEPRFIEIKPEPRRRMRRAALTATRGGLTAVEYRWKTIRKWLRD